MGPVAKTCCFLSSLKTLAMPTEGTSPRAGVNVPEVISVGRFSGDHQWSVLGDRWGKGWARVIRNLKSGIQNLAATGCVVKIFGTIQGARTGRWCASSAAFSPWERACPECSEGVASRRPAARRLCAARRSALYRRAGERRGADSTLLQIPLQPSPMGREPVLSVAKEWPRYEAG